MMYLFLDTEFTDFKHMDLISIGVVSEDGKFEFYQEVNNHIADYRSDFVNEVVMPLLNPSEYGKSYDWVALLFAEWLDNLPSKDIAIVIDYSGDRFLAEKLLQKIPSKKQIRFMLVSDALTQVLQERGLFTPAKNTLAMSTFVEEASKYYQQDPRVHHALVDAKSNRHGWISAINKVSA